jgi:hypothetical protein
VCVECRWRWTVSITGKVYIQSPWAQTPDRDRRMSMVRRLLGSIEGLGDKLALHPHVDADAQPTSEAGFTRADIERLRRARDATAAAYFNEGVPLETLREQGILLPPGDEPD